MIERVPEKTRGGALRVLRAIFPLALTLPLLIELGSAEWLSAQVVLIVGVVAAAALALYGIDAPGLIRDRDYQLSSPRAVSLALAVSLYFVVSLAEDAPGVWALWIVWAVVAVVIVELARAGDVAEELAAASESEPQDLD